MAINARFNGGVDNGTGGDLHSISRSVPAAGGFGAGTLAAGDLIVLLAVGGSAAGGLNAPVISDDISGTVGWHKLVDSGAQTEFRATWWWKLAVGGESSIKGEWTTNGTHRGIEFVAIRNPGGLNEAYVIAQGHPSFNSPNMELGPASPSGNGQMYVGGTAMGPHNYTFAAIKSPPGVHDNNGVGGDGFNAGGGSDGISGILHINDSVGTNVSTNALVYQSQPTETFIWDALIGLRISSAPVNGASTGGLLSGTATPTVRIRSASEGGLFLGSAAPSSAVLGESVGGLFLGSAEAAFQEGGRAAGGLLLGSAEATIEGGTIPSESAGGLVLGGASPTVTPPVPPIPVPAITNVVGCGVYEVLAFTRGGGEIVGSIEFDSLAWARQLDATSAASLTIDGVTNLGALERCCDLLGSLNPWEHEIAIYRQVPGSQQKRRVWMGPITRMRFPNESVVIEALDLSGWLQRRTLHQNHNFVAIDLIDMWVAWVEDAMGVDNSPGLHPTVLGLSGIVADRLTTIVDHSYAADAIAEIATTGIDWTVIDRVMQAGPVLPQPDFDAVDSLPLLLDEAFRVAPEIIVDGMSGANCWFVNGGGVVDNVSIFGEYGPAFGSTPDHVAQPAAPDYAAIEGQYGRIELVVSETRILDQPSIDQAAITRYDLTKNPVPFITGGELVPTAPLPVSQMIPGALLRVKLNRACKPIDAVMRIQSISVSANADGSESVDIGLEPIGTISNG